MYVIMTLLYLKGSLLSAELCPRAQHRRPLPVGPDLPSQPLLWSILALHATLLHKTAPREIRAVCDSVVNLLCGKMETNKTYFLHFFCTFYSVVIK